MRTGKQFKQASLTTLRQNRRLAYAEASPDGEDWVEELEHERIFAIRDSNKARADSPERVKE